MDCVELESTTFWNVVTIAMELLRVEVIRSMT